MITQTTEHPNLYSITGNVLDINTLLINRNDYLTQAAVIERLREALITLTHSCEKSRIWGGMEWVYHPVHPVHYLPALDAARVALGEA